MALTTDKISPGDVIMDPKSPAVIWRVLEIDRDGNQVRVFRSTKNGAVHGLVRDKNGSWKRAPEIKRFTVIGHYPEAVSGSAAAPAATIDASKKASKRGPGRPKMIETIKVDADLANSGSRRPKAIETLKADVALANSPPLSAPIDNRVELLPVGQQLSPGSEPVLVFVQKTLVSMAEMINELLIKNAKS
jgi:hypothetical protein